MLISNTVLSFVCLFVLLSCLDCHFPLRHLVWQLGFVLTSQLQILPFLLEMAFIVLPCPVDLGGLASIWQRIYISHLPYPSDYEQTGDGNPVGRTSDYAEAASRVRLVTHRVQTRRHSLCDTQLQFYECEHLQNSCREH